MKPDFSWNRRRAFLRLTLTAIAIAASTATWAEAQATPDSLQLAHRLVEDQAGGPDYVANMTQSALSGFDRMTRDSHDPNLPGHRAAVQQALAESRSDILKLEDQLADVYAANLTSQEISGWIAFLESPEGHSIQVKKVKAGWPMGQPELTQTEADAQHAFNTSAIGVSIAAKNNVILGQSLRTMLAFQAAVGAKANAIYCSTAKTCDDNSSAH
jgi:hypothetical protein